MNLRSFATACAVACSLISVAAAQESPPLGSQAQGIPATQPSTNNTQGKGVPTSQPATASSPSSLPSDTTTLHKVTVSADLDLAREQIAPSLGANTYTIGLDQIQNIPGGENASVQQVLLRAPGVVLDSFGQQHVRGEHGNVTYRVNGILLPQPIDGFGQELDTRLVQSLTLITGSLPAQFGFHTAGIVDVTTKSGATLQHNELSLYGGSFDTFQPSFQFGGTADRLDCFVTGTYKHDGLGFENPTSSYRALHDDTDQQKLFGYFNYTLDDTSRLSLLLNMSNADYQIPNTPAVPPAFMLAGHSNTNSTRVNENQNQQEYYTVLAYQKSFERLSLQVSAFSRYSSINFRPDRVNDLIFQGVAGNVYNGYLTNGIQFDASYLLNEQHTIRGGLIADYTCEKLATNTGVFGVDSNGNQTSTTPFDIEGDSGNNALEAGFYVQDEWTITPKLTLNYGFRYDRFDANFDHEGQLSPRINMVYKADDKTTLHLGYSRYFVPPPVQDVRLSTLNKFQNTTNAPEIFQSSPPRAERSNYFDMGVSHQITKNWQVNVDGYYKMSHDLIDEGQFGAPVILSPFNYQKGTVYGAELSTTYTYEGLSLYGNFSWNRASGFGPNTQQFLWASDEFSYAHSHSVTLDHESEYTVSAGLSYTWKDDRVYLDFLMGSGLRRGFANTQKEPVYYPVNVGYEHVFHLDGLNKQNLRWRVDLVNIFDQKYQIRDGSGIGVSAAQFGERFGFFTGITYEF